MNLIKSLGLALALVGALASTAKAVPIVGNLFFTSDANATLNNTPALATAITAWGAVAASGGNTGDYAGISGGTAVNMIPGGFTFGSVGTTGPVGPIVNLWQVAGGYSFDLISISTNLLAGSARVVEGLGIAHVTGKDNTIGFFSMSTSGTGTTVSFSAFTSVPDGGSTIALLGFAMVGVAALRRRIKA
jgi:hypothetical protein